MCLPPRCPLPTGRWAIIWADSHLLGLWISYLPGEGCPVAHALWRAKHFQLIGVFPWCFVSHSRTASLEQIGLTSLASGIVSPGHSERWRPGSQLYLLSYYHVFYIARFSSLRCWRSSGPYIKLCQVCVGLFLNFSQLPLYLEKNQIVCTNRNKRFFRWKLCMEEKSPHACGTQSCSGTTGLWFCLGD